MSSKKSREYNWNKLYMAGSVVFLLFTVVPLLAGCFYAVPSADDFFGANAVRTQELEGFSRGVAAGKVTLSVYLSTQGTYTGCFLYYFFSAIIKAQIIPTRITLFIITAFFLAAVYFCMYSFIHGVLQGKSWLINFIYGLIIYIITIGHNVKEIFYWVCGAFMYTVPLVFMLAGIAFAIRAIQSKRKRDLISAAILCFLASGGTLQIAAFVNAVLVGIGIYAYERRKSLLLLPVFLCAFAGALVNVAAPGNYVRQDTIGAELDVIMAIKNAGITVMSGFVDLIRNTPLLLVMILCILIGTQKKCMKLCETAGVIIYGMISLIIIDFPILLAYGTIYMEPRVLFVQNMAIVVVAVICSICIGQILLYIPIRLRSRQRVYEAAGIIGAILTITLMYTGSYKINDIIPLAIYRNLANGSMKEFSDVHEEIFALLENGENKDVVIEYYPSDMGILQPMRLHTEADYWTNSGIARWFGCNTIVLKN